MSRFKLPPHAVAPWWLRVFLLTTSVWVNIGLMEARHGSPYTAAFCLSAFSVILFFLWRSPWLEIGADGMGIRWIGRHRFIPWRDVAKVEERGNGTGKMEVTLLRGDPVLIPLLRGAKNANRIEIVLERVRAAMAAHARGGSFAEQAALLERGERDVAAWIEALRRVGAGANANLRAAPIDADRLWRIVEDPSAEPGARAGAAVALAEQAGGEERTRLRAAADAIASPKVRIAIHAAAEGDDDAALVEALGAIEVDRPSTKGPPA